MCVCVCVLSTPPPSLEGPEGTAQLRGALGACVLWKEPCGSALQSTVVDGASSCAELGGGPCLSLSPWMLLPAHSSDGVRGGVPFPQGEEFLRGLPRQLSCFSWAPFRRSCFTQLTQLADTGLFLAVPSQQAPLLPACSCTSRHGSWQW